MRYPLDRLAAAMGVTENRALTLLGVSGTTGQDYRRNGMSWRVADRLAVKAGFHPGQVWPEWIDDAIADAQSECGECGNSFWPDSNGRQVYCSKRCGARVRRRRRWATKGGRELIQASKRRHYVENAEYYRAAERGRYHEKKGAA